MFPPLYCSSFRRCSQAAAFLAVLCLNLFAGPLQAAEFSNFADMKFVDVPAGSFQMGSCKVTSETQKENKKRAFLGLPLLSTGCSEHNPRANDNETPQHMVTISSFQMGKTLVTLGQFKRYVTASGATKGSSGWNLINDDFTKLNAFGDDAPVVQVSWREAKDFIDWVNKNKPANDHGIYRLPTEAEWEYACRAGGNHEYCGSDSVDEVAWHIGNLGAEHHQHSVGSKTPNAWGLYDMSGNVWQWVEDVYHETYRGAPVDGSAWADIPRNATEINREQQGNDSSARILRVSSDFSREQREYDTTSRLQRGSAWKRDTTTARVLRGGSWKFTPEFARAAYRLAASPGNWYYGNGFRVVRALP